ncbi:tyrosine-type recombinase/integrase [Colwellia sp. MB02u-10]|uniref:tyrosine-type recombinase/integrase n=1 Tax=Colwellia sp. MB02u-10 TaxID=2759828 RepID=UPI0015F681B4|nr:tyrosine-type recombinase/integrase [Colwellia sp. MB02u-10]MBA6341502.1 tyrosine-type recombinase/integrase [Colwellia sp. MB02u-10]
MSFDRSVDVISPLYQAQNTELDVNIKNEILQTKKWKVLIGTFLFVLIVSLILVWTRENIFESQATIQLSKTQIPGEQSSATLMTGSLQSQQRLTSHSILIAVNHSILVNYGIQSSVQLLSEMLSAELQNGQIINLKATGSNREQLQPILSTWVEEYLHTFSAENNNNNADSILRISNMLSALEEKISQQKTVLIAYSQNNNIVSLERDENRILNKVNSLGELLHTAEQDYLNQQEIVNRINYAKKEDQLIIHPKDEVTIGTIKQNIAEIENQLSDFSEKYTRKYMEKDPRIISMKKTLLNLQNQLEEQSLLSQTMYVKEANNNLLVAKSKVSPLTEQLDTLSVKAQVFNRSLKEYTRLNDSLNQLVTQAQSLKDSLLVQEMQQVAKSQFKVLEYPFVPSYPIAPNNQRDSLISLLVAVVISLLALFLFSYIVRQKQASTVFSNYTVVPNDMSDKRQLLHQQEAQTSENQALLEQKSATESFRLLSAGECHKLVSFASKQGKLVIFLVLSGVNIKELLAIKLQDVDLEKNTLEVNGAFARNIALPSEVSVLVTEVMQYKNTQDNIFDENYSLEELAHLTINSAHDAELTEPEEINLENLRHTYLMFLLEQGVKLNSMEKIAGYINPAQLALYRTNRNNTPLQHAKVNTIYPMH